MGSTLVSAVKTVEYAGAVDYIEAGAGPLVVLAHSSLSGARQWSALTTDLKDKFTVRAINLFGYGGTSIWSGPVPPTLDDYAELVAAAVPAAPHSVHLVGHSFGGAVMMQAAAHQLRGRVRSLVVIEPVLFYLLDWFGRHEAFCEISALASYTKRCVSDGRPEAAAERFIDYWSGEGTWATTSPGRRAALAQAITLLPNEWDAVLTGTTPRAAWIAALPADTLVMSCANTARTSQEIVDLLSQARTDWEFVRIPEGGHMAPLTHPQLINPIIQAFMSDRGTITPNEHVEWNQPKSTPIGAASSP
jgi:pimeloyl-ACP methyl ester carboxylesterase